MLSNIKTQFAIGIILVLLTITLSGCFNNQVEYKVVLLDTDTDSAETFAASVEWQLNDLGREGWDCTTGLVLSMGYYAFCKR